MPGSINAKVIWENNPDTSLNASNLSKSIDIISESKFIVYTESVDDKKKWADYALDFEEPASSKYVDKIVYISSLNKYLKGKKNQDDTYGWLESGFPTPDYKMLKILPFTKIQMSYIDTSNNINYLNYDVGPDGALFSNESLIVGDDFLPNTKYNIYAYNTSVLGDYIEIKIVSEYDDENNTGGWKQGIADLGSPTGTRVIAIRKIGGFKTKDTGNIDINSLWDLSTYQKEIIVEKYKIIDNEGVRDFVASDVPLIDTNNNFISNNVEDALADVKVNVDQFYKDVYYTAGRYGVELEYSIFTKSDESLVPIDLNNNSLVIPLRITPGFINIAGKRVSIEAPIYLGDSSLKVKINNYRNEVSNVILGNAPASPYSYDEPVTTIYPGVWRVYLNSDGQIIFREGDDFIPKFLIEEIRKGWYYSQDNSRCIGKFRVRSGTEGFYLEKMSVVNTWDIQVSKNSVHVIHGSMCPDGLFLCDGKWHDTTGHTSTVYNNMPSPDGIEWAQSWWEQTPNLYGRTFKMFDESDFEQVAGNTLEKTVPQPPFKWDLDLNQEYCIITSGSSDDMGEAGGNNEHFHSMAHQHSPSQQGGDLRIQSYQGDTHGHENDTFIVDPNADIVQASKYTGGAQTPINVASGSHIHNGNIIPAAGLHGHSTNSFVGLVGQPTEDNTGTTSSWAPYKEFIYCIKK